MNKILSIETERVDDIPLLISHMQHMKLIELLDKHFTTHGHRKGLSLGEVSVVWLAHILSQADHRMNRVQEWAARRLETLRGSGMSNLETRDRTDDRLADVLRILSDDVHWQACEQELMGQLVRVYELQAHCVRIDTTTVSSYIEVNDQGLLQLGHSKDHRPDLPQLKIVLASLDPMGMPLATEIISGENADDPVYLPIIARVREGLQQNGLLYVGDCKMAALQTRAMLQAKGDFYLCPLSAVQMPAERLWQAVLEQRTHAAHLVQVMRTDEQGQSGCIAHGYETVVSLSAEVGAPSILERTTGTGTVSGCCSGRSKRFAGALAESTTSIAGGDDAATRKTTLDRTLCGRGGGEGDPHTLLC
jgi:transposase